MYRYLALRAVVGRTTLEAIQGLDELIAAHPDFGPAHRTLAEIYGTEAFRDADKEKSEKTKFLALCPGGNFTRRPPPVPERSPLLDEAERLLAANGDPGRIIAMTTQGLQEFVWRSQRIRAFDWYSRDQKIERILETKEKYWQALPIQVRALRKAGRIAEANQALVRMEQRAALLRYQPGPLYWEALAAMVRLHAEDRRFEDARRELNEMRKVREEQPDASREHEFEALRRLIPLEPDAAK
jgi:hypothetical protein